MAEKSATDSNTIVDEEHQTAAETVIPLAEESISVSKQLVEKSRVQVSRVTHAHEELVDEMLRHDQVEVERIPIGQPVDAMPSVREEGGIIIVPVVEEVLKIERQLVLKEEVRIRRVSGTERYQERVTLRKQEAVVTRLTGKQPPSPMAEDETGTTKR